MGGIAVRNLRKRFGATTAVDDLSFDVVPGRVTGFLGPNGAGKTTTLRVALGLVSPTTGSVTVDGVSYRRLAVPARAVGALLEDSSAHPAHSGRNHLRAVALAAGVDTARVDPVLEQVGLADAARRRVGGYSLGMRQRLGLAAALLGDPPVLILDEPANGLDPQGIRWLRELLVARARGGGTVLVSSHVLAEVAQLADDIVIVDRGRLIAQGPVEEISGRLGRGTRVTTESPGPLAELLTAQGGAVERSEGQTLVVRDLTPVEVGRLAAQHGIVLAELIAAGPNLEEAFLELVQVGRDGAGTPA